MVQRMLARLSAFARLSVVAVVAGGAALAAGPLAAQPYPHQPVKLVAPFPPGGGADVIARLYAQQLSTALGQPFVVENKPGVGTLLAAGQVAKAPADGYTVLTATADTLAVASTLFKNPPAIPENELTPVTQIVRTPLFVVVRPESPLRSLADIVAAARQAPGKLTFGSAGVGTIHHLALELWQREAKIEVRHIAYKGSSPAVTDLIGGHIDAMFLDSPTALAQLKGSKIRALAVTTAQRLALAPDVPTVAELGYPGFEALTWMGFAVARDTPPAIVDKLFASIRDAGAQPELTQRLRDMGLDPVISASPQAFADYAARERKRWSTLIKSAGIEAN
ncbi:MAG: Bug family tripartite tricarboxylate transporter substrate binding protein [Lautropia sp.]